MLASSTSPADVVDPAVDPGRRTARVVYAQPDPAERATSSRNTTGRIVEPAPAPPARRARIRPSATARSAAHAGAACGERPAAARRGGRSTATRVGRPRALYRQQGRSDSIADLRPTSSSHRGRSQAGSGSPSAAARARHTAGGIPVAAPALGAVMRPGPGRDLRAGARARAAARRRARRGRRSGRSRRPGRPAGSGPPAHPGVARPRPRPPSPRTRPTVPNPDACLAHVVQERGRHASAGRTLGRAGERRSRPGAATASDPRPGRRAPIPSHTASSAGVERADRPTRPRRVVERTRRAPTRRTARRDARPARASGRGSRSSQRRTSTSRRRNGSNRWPISTLPPQNTSTKQHEDPVRAGTGTSRAATSRGSTRSRSAAPSSGGIGRRLKSPRNRFTSANEQRDQHRAAAARSMKIAPNTSAGTARARPARRRPSAARFVAGPASETNEHVAARVAEPARIHRHRLGPADHRDAGQRAQRRQDDRSERIDVRDRIEREPPGPLARCRHRTTARRPRG